MKTITLDSKVYSINAVRRAAYEFREAAEVDIQSLEEGVILVAIDTDKRPAADEHQIESQLKQLALDHQVRIDVEEECKAIRQILIAQAFFPCSNLEEIFKAQE